MIKNLVGIRFKILQTTIPENLKQIGPLEEELDKKVCEEQQQQQEEQQQQQEQEQEVSEWICYSAGAE